MTVIAAYAAHDWVAIAADSVTWWDTERLTTTKKLQVVPVGDREAIIATSGRHRLNLLVRHDLTLPSAPDPADDHDCDAWAQRVIEALVELALEAVPPARTDDGLMDGSAFLVYAGRLWFLEGDASSTRIHGPQAVGSGAQYACGSLHRDETAPRAVFGPIYELDEGLAAVRRACDAAIRWCGSTGGPIYWAASRRGDPDIVMGEPGSGWMQMMGRRAPDPTHVHFHTGGLLRPR